MMGGCEMNPTTRIRSPQRGKYRSALHQVAALQGKDVPLGEDHRLVEHRPILEAEHQAALDFSVPADLEKTARSQEDILGGAQNEEAMEGSLEEARPNRGRREGAMPQQRGHENQESCRRSPVKRHG
jgi:hypothetical protein